MFLQGSRKKISTYFQRKGIVNTALCFATYRYAEEICGLGTRISGGGAVRATGRHLPLIHESFHDGEELAIHEYFHDGVELHVSNGQETHVDRGDTV